MSKMKVPKGYNEYRKKALELGELHGENESEKIRGYIK